MGSEIKNGLTVTVPVTQQKLFLTINMFRKNEVITLYYIQISPYENLQAGVTGYF